MQSGLVISCAVVEEWTWARDYLTLARLKIPQIRPKRREKPWAPIGKNYEEAKSLHSSRTWTALFMCGVPHTALFYTHIPFKLFFFYFFLLLLKTHKSIRLIHSNFWLYLFKNNILQIKSNGESGIFTR